MEIIEKESLIVVGLPVKASWQDLWVEMPKAWSKFFSRYTEIDNRPGNVLVDVSLDKNEDQYLQLICTQVFRVDQVPDGMRAIEIPAQRYIYHRHNGPVQAIDESFGAMYDWAEKHGHAASDFKIDFGYTVDGGELEHDLFIGLLPVSPWRDVKVG